MKLIRTEDAAGQVLCHDITQIIPGEFKGARFRKGHIIQPEDIPVLLSIGKENLYVWEKKPGILHEDEAAALLYKAAAGKNIHGTEPKEGKIELIADCDGLLKINREALLAVNRTPQMMIATIHGDLPVKKGQPSSITCFAFSGVLMLPSAITLCFAFATIFLKISKSFASILSPLLCSV